MASRLVAADLADVDPGRGIAVELDHGRGGHPVGRLVAAGVGVDEDRAVGLDHQEADGQGEDGREATGVDDLAAGDDQAHAGPDYGSGRIDGRGRRGGGSGGRGGGEAPGESGAGGRARL